MSRELEQLFNAYSNNGIYLSAPLRAQLGRLWTVGRQATPSASGVAAADRLWREISEQMLKELPTEPL